MVKAPGSCHIASGFNFIASRDNCGSCVYISLILIVIVKLYIPNCKLNYLKGGSFSFNADLACPKLNRVLWSSQITVSPFLVLKTF